MVFIGNSFFPLDQQDQRVDVSNEVVSAFERLRDATSSSSLIRSRFSSAEGYDEYRFTAYAAEKSNFHSIFDFYAHLPGIVAPSSQSPVIWTIIAPAVTLDKLYEYCPEPVRSLGGIVDMQEQVQLGFVVSYEVGRIDEDITWGHRKRLIATDRSFLFVDYYSITLH